MKDGIKAMPSSEAAALQVARESWAEEEQAQARATAKQAKKQKQNSRRSKHRLLNSSKLPKQRSKSQIRFVIRFQPIYLSSRHHQASSLPWPPIRLM